MSDMYFSVITQIINTVNKATNINSITFLPPLVSTYIQFLARFEARETSESSIKNPGDREMILTRVSVEAAIGKAVLALKLFYRDCWSRSSDRVWICKWRGGGHRLRERFLTVRPILRWITTAPDCRTWIWCLQGYQLREIARRLSAPRLLLSVSAIDLCFLLRDSELSEGWPAVWDRSLSRTTVFTALLYYVRPLSEVDTDFSYTGCFVISRYN